MGFSRAWLGFCPSQPGFWLPRPKPCRTRTRFSPRRPPFSRLEEGIGRAGKSPGCLRKNLNRAAEGFANEWDGFICRFQNPGCRAKGKFRTGQNPVSRVARDRCCTPNRTRTDENHIVRLNGKARRCQSFAKDANGLALKHASLIRCVATAARTVPGNQRFGVHTGETGCVFNAFREMRKEKFWEISALPSHRGISTFSLTD